MRNNPNLKALIVVLFSTVALFFACRRGYTDTIMLSGREYSLKADGDSVIVTSQGKWWWFADLMLDSTHYSWQPNTTGNCNEFYSDSNFTVVRKSCDTLFVKMNRNSKTVPRSLWIQVAAGDYFSSVLFTQAKK